MKNNKKGLTVIGILALCAVLILGGILFIRQSGKDEVSAFITEQDGQTEPDGKDEDVTPKDIIVPTMAPSPTPDASETETSGDIPLTAAPAKSETPEPPATAPTPTPAGTAEEATPADVEEHEALDPALKNPEAPPSITPAPVEPDKPEDATPAGETNGNGEVFIPGFGWVKDEGGGGQGESSGSDGDWNKIIGY